MKYINLSRSTLLKFNKNSLDSRVKYTPTLQTNKVITNDQMKIRIKKFQFHLRKTRCNNIILNSIHTQVTEK